MSLPNHDLLNHDLVNEWNYKFGYCLILDNLSK